MTIDYCGKNVDLYYENCVAFCCCCINYRYSYYIDSEKIHKTPSILMHTKDEPNRNIFFWIIHARSLNKRTNEKKNEIKNKKTDRQIDRHTDKQKLGKEERKTDTINEWH